MKIIKYLNRIILSLALLVVFQACETDFVNPNAPSEDQILSTREGLLNLSVGIKQLHSTSGIRWAVETPAITTREGGITTTFQNMIELEDGGAGLPNFNSNVRGIWATSLKVMSMSEDLIESATNVALEPGTESGMIAWGHLFKAISIGNLSQNFEQVIIQTSLGNDATFVTREQGYAEAIRLLEAAAALVSATPISTEFANVATGSDIDLGNTINAYLARYYLFAGQYEDALAAASSVNLGTASYFTYDTQNPNPIWGRVFQGGAPNFKPRDNFGLPASFSFAPDDGRVSFYLDPSTSTNQNGLPIEELKGFFQTDTDPVPVFLPGEMTLIIAEANVRKASPDLAAAKNAIDAILTKSNDPTGVNADLASGYSGAMDANSLLTEIYRNRRAELFLTGISLEDSRRFNRPQPSSAAQVFTDERNRNFYPYPDRERSNNSNTPADPTI